MGTTTTNVLIVGVGGQGTLLASKILGAAAMLAGLDVKQSEVHGMAQRGGSVVTYVRFGDQVHSPLIDKGDADVIIAFEALEALRWAPYLKPGGTLIVNEQEIPPMPVILGMTAYPDDIAAQLSKMPIKTIIFNALTIARAIGEARSVNVILLAVAAQLLPFSYELWQQAITAAVPAKTLQVNQIAFDAGWKLPALQASL